MRIAQVSPLFESVPPKLYGGTERVVAYLTDQLVAQGHDVTLYASGDSRTSAKLVSTTPHALRLDPTCHDALAHHYVLFEQLIRDRRNFDCIHFHTDHLHFGLARHLGLPHVTTLHGRLDFPELTALYEEFSDLPVTSISRSQQAALPNANWVGTVYHGLPVDRFQFSNRKDGYLAFLGRVSPEKGLDRAIEIAARAGLPLRVAAKVDRVDREYYLQQIQPLLQSPYVQFIGEISEGEKNDFLGGARALLFPIDWPEPFGLVMIEALACGTPVIAFRRGSAPELIADGLTGFLVDSIEEAVDAVKRVERLSRSECRQEFEARFSARRMAEEYAAIFQSIGGGGARARVSRGDSRWKKPFKTSSTSLPPTPGLTSEPAY